MSLTSRAAVVWSFAAVLALAGCDKVPLLAPTNTTIRLNVGLGVLPVSGSTEVTAIVIEAAGTPVQNGTVVTFTSSLGTVEPREARTANGQVTVRYIAGAQSGTAKIGAFSGGSKSDEVEILVGAAAAGALSLRADPSAFVPATGGTADIIATVLDTGGNPLRGAPVRFTTNFGQLSQTTALTNDAGEARTQLTTNVTAEVTARIGAGASAPEGKVTITARELPSVTIDVSNPFAGSGAEIGQPVNIKLTPAANASIRSGRIDFGDGSSANLGPINAITTIPHTYTRTGSFTVVVTVTDALGFNGSSSVVVTVTERSTVPIQIVVQGQLQLVVTFNASITGGTVIGSILTYQWDFGDGDTLVSTGPNTAHRYRTAGNYVVSVRVVTTTGQEGYTSTTVRVA